MQRPWPDAAIGRGSNNAALAEQLVANFREKGFEPWTAYTSGAYRKFLTRHDSAPSLAEAVDRLTILRPMLRSE